MNVKEGNDLSANIDTNITIVEYEDQYHMAFRSLNLAWLEQYHLTEPPDLEVLDDPRGTILNHGGFIWLACVGEELVGSAALINEENGVYELAKMAVAPQWQGKGISKSLIEACLLKVREMKGRKIVLFSNHQLVAALRLYERYGFIRVALKDSPFQTADVKMELVF